MASQSASKDSGQSRIPNFFKMTIRQRLDALRERDLLSDDDLALLAAGDHTLRVQTADKMIENVVGVLGLPLGVALNFLINGRDYVVPLCVEEPSIVAGLSAAARTARLSGGFKSSATEAILIGQVQLVDMGDPLMRDRAPRSAPRRNRQPRQQPASEDGGARRRRTRHRGVPPPPRPKTAARWSCCICSSTPATRWARTSSTRCAKASRRWSRSITGGKVFLRILSNLTDRRSAARADDRFRCENLEGKGYTGEEVRDGIILANDLATRRSVPRRDPQQGHHERHRRRGDRHRQRLARDRGGRPRLRGARPAATRR